MLIPTVRRTWAPVGQTPIIRHRYNHARISVIGGLSVSPKRRRLGFYFRLHAKNISRDEVHDFLWYLLRHLRGHVIVIWDGASIHHRNGLDAICDQYPRLHLEKLPAYAPELNPVEYIWGYMKQRELANLCLHTIGEVGTFARNRLKSMQRRRQLITAFWQQAQLPI